MAMPMVKFTPSSAPMAIALILTGCGADTANYPSLARRPAERISGSSPAVPVGPAPIASPAPPSPELAARLEQLLGNVRSADVLFKARETKARLLATAAAGAPVASDSWSLATLALADLESARSNAMIALADLDALYAATRISGGDEAAIAATRDQAIAIIQQEDRILVDLYSMLAS